MTARHHGADTVEQQHAQHPRQKSLSECPICHSSDEWHWQIIGYYQKIGLWVEWCEKCGHIIPHTPYPTTAPPIRSHHNVDMVQIFKDGDNTNKFPSGFRRTR